ncbi:MAG: hypothetical protein H0T62_05465 [Parachlamydiaceae bacterium]|nr:hypothetical protein [Parachlamydiaceae bacterium]
MQINYINTFRDPRIHAQNQHSKNENQNFQNLEHNIKKQVLDIGENQSYFHSSKPIEVSQPIAENFHRVITNKMSPSFIECESELVASNSQTKVIALINKVKIDHHAEIELLNLRLALAQNREIGYKTQYAELKEKHKIVLNDANKFFNLSSETERKNKIISANNELLKEKISVLQASDLTSEKKSLELKIVTLSNELIQAKEMANVLQRHNEKNKVLFATEIENLNKNQTSNIKH